MMGFPYQLIISILRDFRTDHGCFVFLGYSLLKSTSMRKYYNDSSILVFILVSNLFMSSAYAATCWQLWHCVLYKECPTCYFYICHCVYIHIQNMFAQHISSYFNTSVYAMSKRWCTWHTSWLCQTPVTIVAVSATVGDSSWRRKDKCSGTYQTPFLPQRT